MPLTLHQALHIPSPTITAFIGAGGKTRGMFTLARELEPPVLLTTTTHLGLEQATWADAHLVVTTPNEIPDPLPQKRLVLTGPRAGQRWTGISPETWSRLLSLAHQGIPLLVEADGAAGRQLKAPAEHEPALPPGVTAVVTVAGLDALGHPLDETYVHRARRFRELAGLQPTDPITPEALARVLAHPQGGRKGVPNMAVWRVLLVGSTDEALSLARPVANTVWRHAFGTPIAVARGRERDLETQAVFLPVAGIVLAAGPSQRMGEKTKLLLPVEGEPMIRRVTRAALLANLHPVIVVVGHAGEEVARAVADLPVEVVHNPLWEQGQSTSVRAGLQALPEGVGAAVFLLADMPLVTPTLIQALVDAHAQTQAPIVAPLVDQRRGNPVLFDQQTFPALQALQGDVGGRTILRQFPVHYVPWFDETTQIDVDTPEDYQQLRRLFL